MTKRTGAGSDSPLGNELDSSAASARPTSEQQIRDDSRPNPVTQAMGGSGDGNASSPQDLDATVALNTVERPRPKSAAAKSKSKSGKGAKAKSEGKSEAKSEAKSGGKSGSAAPDGSGEPDTTSVRTVKKPKSKKGSAAKKAAAKDSAEAASVAPESTPADAGSVTAQEKPSATKPAAVTAATEKASEDFSEDQLDSVPAAAEAASPTADSTVDSGSEPSDLDQSVGKLGAVPAGAVVTEVLQPLESSSQQVDASITEALPPAQYVDDLAQLPIEIPDPETVQAGGLLKDASILQAQAEDELYLDDFDVDGFDIDGFDIDGYDRYGYRREDYGTDGVLTEQAVEGLEQYAEEDYYEEPARGGILGFFREIATVLGIAIILSVVLKTFLIQAFYIPSESMQNTLNIGDRVIVSKLTPGPIPLQRGDIVVFEDPGDWLDGYVPDERRPGLWGLLDQGLETVGLKPARLQNHLIKRVIGVAGDTVVCCDAEDRIQINGASIDEPYLYAGDDPSLEDFTVTIPEGYVWVMGDHRSNSLDSRYHRDENDGLVPVENVVGRGLLVVWPFTRFGWLDGYHDQFADAS